MVHIVIVNQMVCNNYERSDDNLHIIHEMECTREAHDYIHYTLTLSLCYPLESTKRTTSCADLFAAEALEI